MYLSQKDSQMVYDTQNQIQSCMYTVMKED